MTDTSVAPAGRAAPARLDLAGQTVVVLGGTSGIGLATAQQASTAGARLIITGRNRERLQAAGRELDGARTATLDLGDPAALDALFADLPPTLDHVLVSGGGPYYAPLAELDFDRARQSLDEHLLGALRVARACVGRVRPGGSITYISGTHARRPGPGLSLAAVGAASLPVIAANLAVELAPIRVNAVAAGFVDTPLSARILGDAIEQRREELRATLPIRRVVGPDDVAAAVVHLMTNSAVTGATFDVDGGQQLIPW
jgi:NAD(P)-dependent dehydrogenase (short-subunit alcohol dehydrogenase family)